MEKIRCAWARSAEVEAREIQFLENAADTVAGLTERAGDLFKK